MIDAVSKENLEAALQRVTEAIDLLKTVRRTVEHELSLVYVNDEINALRNTKYNLNLMLEEADIA
jgi:hypothetical protein